MDIKSLQKSIEFRRRPLIFLDLETTGLEPQKHEIIEIGALKVNPLPPFPVIEQLEMKIRPENIKKADPEALKVNGYSPVKWLEALPLPEALKKLDLFAQGGILIGFNSSFDWAFLDKAYFTQGRKDPFHYHRLDVLSIAFTKLFHLPSVTKFSLSDICKKLKIVRQDQHQALADAQATYLVFLKLFGYTGDNK